MLKDLFQTYKWDGRPWLICGKGPSFNPVYANKESYNLLTLNQVVREVDTEFCHIIDSEVLRDVGDIIEKRAKYLVMPYHPHIGHRADLRMTLQRMIDFNWYPVLKKMADQGRLLAYNLSTIPVTKSPSPVVEARWFSAEAAVSIIANMGCKEIRTLGVDGGYDQSKTFIDLKNHNTDRGYDRQWAGIRRLIAKHNLIFGPLWSELPIRVFVGCSDGERVPFEVLRYTIERHSTSTVQVEPLSKWMHKIPKVHNSMYKSRTPFSFQRFLIPEICGFKGKAIYLDSDMQVFADIRDLWDRDFHGKDMIVPRETDTDRRKAQYSAMLLDCGKLDWHIEEIVGFLDMGAFTYEQIMHEMIIANPLTGVCPEWNSLESYKKGFTKLLHYTDFQTQPWKYERHPLKEIWEEDLRGALKRGYVSKSLLQEHVDKGYVRASLLSLTDPPQLQHPAETTSDTNTSDIASA